MAERDLKKPSGPVKPSRPGLHTVTRTTEPRAPALTPRWGASPDLPRAPTGWVNPGLSSERTRARMVERLTAQGIRDTRVLAAMRQVPRHRFVDEALASRAYEDTALPIGHQQTISQPYVVARTIELALGLVSGPERPLRALELGSGCGYQAAVMSYCFSRVVSVERIRTLFELARANLSGLRRSNLKVIYGDGVTAAAADGPFDVILCSAALPSVPQELMNQLAVGGVLVAPVGESDQRLMAVQRVTETDMQTHWLDWVRYVPVLRGTE
jgi:protein-L-isoaspartate(D-aspartate) O-methyltransferase